MVISCVVEKADQRISCWLAFVLVRMLEKGIMHNNKNDNL